MAGSAISDGIECSGNLSTSVADDSGKSFVVDMLGSGYTSVDVSNAITCVSDGSSSFATGGSANMICDGSRDVCSEDFSADFI